MNIKTKTVPVKNATIFYKIYNEGKPILLMISGGTGDADSYESILPNFVDQYTIVTYDRRGYTRSPIDQLLEHETIDIETQSDDVSALIRSITHEPVIVFGSSLGAVIAIDLVIRYPDLVTKIIAHEPPLVRLIPEEEKKGKAPEILENEHPLDAIKRFMASFGMVPTELTGQSGKPVTEESRIRKTANAKFFLEHESDGVNKYKPDPVKLKAIVPKTVFMAGKESKGNFLYAIAIKTASEYGIPFFEMPGHHVGYAQFPKEFSKALIDILNR
jgi:acetyltransferase/esterase